MSPTPDGAATHAPSPPPGPGHPLWDFVVHYPPGDSGARAWAALQNELPFLVEVSRGRWVAYHGERLMVVSSSPHEAFDACVAMGAPAEECLICLIDPALAAGPRADAAGPAA